MAGIFDPGIFDSGIFDTPSGGGTVSGSFTADAVIRRTQTGSLTADAIFRRTQSASFTADAAITIAISGSFTADAVLRKTQSGSFTASAVLRRTQSASFTADAVIAAAFFTADAVIRKVQTGSFTANAVKRKTTSASITADADIIVGTRHFASFTGDAVIHRTQSHSFTIDAWIYAPRADPDGPGEPGETPLVSIIVGGVDVTADVVMADANFTMLVNGAIGSFSFRVRDDDHTWNFTSGAEVTVDIDGKRRFGGYLMLPKRMLAFPVEDTTDPTRPSRFHLLTGTDYNVLMSRRILYDHSDPANVALRSWPADSDSDVVIKYIFDHYTDLGADGVTYNGVTNVGSPNPDLAGVVGSGGLRFVDAMKEINRLISGVFYIDAYKDLNFVDVDTPNAEFDLSDNPTGGELGYREFTHTENGTGLVNDAMVWGAGLGMQQGKLVFSRVEDAASIAEHGRWQFGEFTNALFRQASVDRRADTIVNGTEQSKRGGKDPQESWKLISFNTTWEVGQKVQIESEVFDISDVVPIRRMTMTFVGNKRPKFDLTLSHEIDEPWNLFEFWFPKFPPFTPPNFDLIFDGHLPPATAGCIKSTLDDCNRTLSGTWGTASSGGTWGANPNGSANGTALVMPHTPSSGSTLNYPEDEIDMVLSITTPTWPTGVARLIINPRPAAVDLFLTNAVILEFSASTISVFRTDVPAELSYVWSQGSDYEIRIQCNASRTRVKVWPSVFDEPAAWTVDNFYPYDTGTQVANFTIGNSGTSGTGTEYLIRNIDYYPECSDCVELVIFDDFEGRSTSTPDWGTASGGSVYSGSVGSSGTASVGSGIGSLALGSGSSSFAQEVVGTVPAYLATTELVSIVARFRFATTTGNHTLIFSPWGMSAQFQINPNTSGGYIAVFNDNWGSAFDFTNAWTANTWYYARFEVQPNGIMRGKVWIDTDPEPGWQVAQGGITPSQPSDDFTVRYEAGGSTGSGRQIDVDFIKFFVYGEGCHDAGDPVVRGRDSFTGDGTTTVFTVLYPPYIPNSTRVFVDGYFYRPFGLDYVELDPEAGTIEFNDPPADGAQITIFYWQVD